MSAAMNPRDLQDGALRAGWLERLAVLAALSAACGAPAAGSGTTSSSNAKPADKPSVRRQIDVRAVLAKGINFDHIFEPWWEPGTPYGEEDHRRIAAAIREEEFALVSELGFTHVRLALGQTFLQDRSPPYALRPDMLALVDSALDLAAKHRLAVVLDMHQTPVPNLAGDSGELQAFRTLWRALAARYRAREQPIVFELLNEPRVEDSAVWRSIVRMLIAEIRQEDPDRTIVITGGGWGTAEDLVALGDLNLPNLVYTFHFYEPQAFTHQGDRWSDRVLSRLRSIRYPLDAAQIRREAFRARRDGLEDWPFEGWKAGGGKNELRRRLEPVFDLGRREGLILYCGEFGVHKTYAPTADRARWIADVRDLLEEHGVAWSLWEYRGDFELLDEKGRPARTIVEALGLRVPGEPDGKKRRDGPMTLKELAGARGIRIGSHYDYEFRGKTHDTIFEREFNAMTVGFFGEVIYPGGGRDLILAETDEAVSLAAAHGMEVFGQTLVWFEDIPAWVKATPVGRVEAAMFRHIDALVSRYAGRVKLWNVVNEAIDDEGRIRLNHKWAQALGPDYIDKAFIRAHAADPAAVLYYNDFDIESNDKKYAAVKALLKGLLDKGVPLHALGWQMHVKPGSFDPATLLARFNEIADMGLDNYITELDVELPPVPTPEDFAKQKQTYKTVVEVFLAARRRKTIVVWGVRDGSPHWLKDGHALLLDERYRRKPAYFGVKEALQ